MRSMQEHLAHIVQSVAPVPALRVALLDAMGCILAADVEAPHDLPETAVAALDGYAVRASDLAVLGQARALDVAQTGILPRITENMPPPPPGADASTPATVELPVVADLTAADTLPLTLGPRTAIRVASGARLPLGADAVVPLIWTDRGTARVQIRKAVSPGSGVRGQGADARTGDVVLKAGVRLGPRQISLAAALGYPGLPVHPKPRVVIVSIGDELIQPGSGRGTSDANSYAIAAAVRDAGATAIRVGIVSDAHATLREAIEDQLVRADLIVTTGGVSEGSSDSVRDVLMPYSDVRFDHVAIAPGRHQGFGVLQAFDREVPIVCLPGHPAAAFISFEVFVRPALRAMAGYSDIYRPSVIATVG